MSLVLKMKRFSISGEGVNLVQQLRDLIAVELLHVAQISPQLLHLHSPKQTVKWVSHANDHHLFVL